MDDFIILVKDKESAKKIFQLIEEFITENLNLKLNKKSRYYPSKQGCDFCGYIVHENYKLLRKNSIKKMNKKIKKFKKNEISYEEFIKSYNSWQGHAKHADSKTIIDKFNYKLKIKL